MQKALAGQRVSMVTPTNLTDSAPTCVDCPAAIVTMAGSLGVVGEEEHAAVDAAMSVVNKKVDKVRIQGLRANCLPRPSPHILRGNHLTMVRKERPSIIIVLNRCQADEIMDAGSKPNRARPASVLSSSATARRTMSSASRVAGALWLRVMVEKSS